MAILTQETLTHEAGGTLIKLRYRAERLKRGTERDVQLYIPAAVTGQNAESVGVLINFDGMLECNPAVMEKLIAEKIMPPTVTVGVVAATYSATQEGGFNRSVRSPEYDGLGSSLPDFLIEELLPALAPLLPQGMTFSTDPDRNMACGGSSGGIAAWNVCWERNDRFRRCYISSPTYSCFRGGDCYPFLMRKYETKKIRVYITTGTDDMRNSAGDWYLEDLSAKEALEFAGYEYEFLEFANGPHCAGYGDAETLEKALRFLWSVPTAGVRHFAPRVADIFEVGSEWEKTLDTMPAAPGCPYSFVGKNILLGEKVVATLPGNVSALALSSDRWRLYAATTERRFVYAYAILPDGSLIDGYAHGHLHLKDDLCKAGASGICIDSGDRLYAATELGIQTISQQGENNTILPLPGHQETVAVAFHPQNGCLYVQAADGSIYKRKVLTLPPNGTIQEPNTKPF